MVAPIFVDVGGLLMVIALGDTIDAIVAPAGMPGPPMVIPTRRSPVFMAKFEIVVLLLKTFPVRLRFPKVIVFPLLVEVAGLVIVIELVDTIVAILAPAGIPGPAIVIPTLRLIVLIDKLDMVVLPIAVSPRRGVAAALCQENASMGNMPEVVTVPYEKFSALLSN